VHVLVDGEFDRTVASNLTAEDLLELRLRGANPAGPPLATPAAVRAGDLHPNAVIEIDRAVDASGNITLGPARLKIGANLARRRVTLRSDGHLVHVVADGALTKTLPAPADLDYTRLRGVRLAVDALPPAPAGPIHVERRVGRDGVVMVTRQSLRIGRVNAGKNVTIIVEDTHLRVLHNGEELSLHARTSNQPVTRFTAYAPRPDR
jgi:hypothetical protein